MYYIFDKNKRYIAHLSGPIFCSDAVLDVFTRQQITIEELRDRRKILFNLSEARYLIKRTKTTLKAYGNLDISNLIIKYYDKN